MNKLYSEIADMSKKDSEKIEIIGDDIDKAASKVFHSKRLYFGERRTMFYIEIYQPQKYYPKSIESKNNSQIHRTIHVVKLENYICRLFNIPDNTAGFKITSTTTNVENMITELSIAYVQGYNVSIILDYFKQ